METSVIFALGAFGTWAATQRILSDQLTSNPSTSTVYTRNGAATRPNFTAYDPRRVNAFTSDEYWNLIDQDELNTLKFNAMLSRNHPVINWWYAGELKQAAPPQITNRVPGWTVGPYDAADNTE